MYDEQIQNVLEAHKRLRNTQMDQLDNSLIVKKVDDDRYVVREQQLNNSHISAEQIHVVNHDGVTPDNRKIALDFRFFVDVAIMEKYDWIQCVVNSTMKHTMIWNQSEVALPPLSIMHAKYYFGEVPVSAPIGYTRGDSLPNVVVQEVMEVLHYGNPRKVRSMFVPKLDTLTWGSDLDDTLELALALETLTEHAWEVTKECDGCLSYLPYALVDEIYQEYHKD